jgi:hypothetical protein
VGASDFKPVFVAMGTISVVTFDLAFIAERWLRHAGRLVHNTSRTQKFLAVASIIFSVAGAAGLILLTIFDTKNHKNLHDTFLGIFIGKNSPCGNAWDHCGMLLDIIPPDYPSVASSTDFY